MREAETIRKRNENQTEGSDKHIISHKFFFLGKKEKGRVESFHQSKINGDQKTPLRERDSETKDEPMDGGKPTKPSQLTCKAADAGLNTISEQQNK
jgi:hypothetical protein